MAGPGYYTLNRVSRILDRVNVAPTNHGEITCSEILGENGITVHLVIGEPGRSARHVLEGGLIARTGYGRDRPFGFFASHRASGLVLAAGWVAEPEQYLLTGEELALRASL